jgi:hypothetical protein
LSLDSETTKNRYEARRTVEESEVLPAKNKKPITVGGQRQLTVFTEDAHCEFTRCATVDRRFRQIS